jgi:hypothetical protein
VQEIRHGYFTSVVEADNIERAVAEFKESKPFIKF